MSRTSFSGVGDSFEGAQQRSETPPDEPNPRVHYASSGVLSADPPAGHEFSNVTRTDTNRSANINPIFRRRTGRVGTFKTVDDFEDYGDRAGWHPGSEPGLDPSKPDGGHASMSTLKTPCEITAVDFSHDNLSIRRLNNDTLSQFLAHPQPEWSKCRWINVNGLSWDVIQTLGRYKNLHKLTLEDIMNTRNRTKAEWYPTHAFIILTLQKLVHIYAVDDSDSSDYDSDNDGMSRASEPSLRSEKRRRGFWRTLHRLFDRKKRKAPDSTLEVGKESVTDEPRGQAGSQRNGGSGAVDLDSLRTLQRYRGSPSDPRTLFMEKNSSLSSRDLAVACEQVSMFITQDNTIISFFEQSAQDVEAPIIRRLQTNDTILRKSCDASMVGQAIIDVIIDLVIPVTSCYGDVIGDLELDVLTRPTLEHTKSLYIVITEISKMLTFMNPITTVINALRDHMTDVKEDTAISHLQDPSTGVIITPMTYIYLGDALDHCVLMTESLDQLRAQARGMIDLIFNTISTYQNESMKQLTTATIIFLPLTFLTGYFGQNFRPFEVLENDVVYFWKIAIPVAVVITLFMMRSIFYEYIVSIMQRRYILRLRHKHLRKRKTKRF